MAKALRSPFFAGLALVLLTVLAYLPGLSGGFIFDDYPNIVSNPRIHAATLDWESLKQAATGYEAAGSSRLIATASFAADHAIAGTQPRQYKTSSLVVHVLNALLVWLLLRSLQRLPAWNLGTGQGLPLALAAIWAVHPLQVSTVLYVVQRMETLSLLFVLLALLAYVRGRRLQSTGARGWPWLACCLPLVALGMLAKESAALFPVYALALELTVLGFKARSEADSKKWRLAYAVGVIASIALFLLWLLPIYSTPDAYAHRNFGIVERVLTQFRVLSMYLGMILVPTPAGYVFYYDDLVASQGWLNPATTLAGAMFLSALLAAAFIARRRLPLFSLGIFLFLGAHLITSNIVPLELAFEHRNYFALLGVVIAVADLALRLISRLGLGIGMKRATAAAIVCGILAIAILRSATWGDPLLLAMDLVTRNQNSARASNDMAEQFMVLSDMNRDSPFFSLGIQEFERGAKLASASPLPEQGLIMMSAAAEAPIKPEWWDSLQRKLETQPIGPQEVGTVSLMLKQRRQGLQIDDRRLADAYTTLTERTPLAAHQYADLGDHALNVLHDRALAERMFNLAVDSSVGDVAYIQQMAQVLSDEGNVAMAQSIRRRATTHGIAIVPVTPKVRQP